MTKPTGNVIEWRLYRSRGWMSDAIGWRSNGADGEYTHVDVLDPRTGWLWGAHCDSMMLPVTAVPTAYAKFEPLLLATTKGVHIPSGFFPRPPNYQAKQWRRVTAFRLKVSELQLERFWDFTRQQWSAPYDTRGLLETYVLGRDWRDPGAWYCSEEQAAACEYSFILRKLIYQAVEPADFAGLLNQAGAHQQDLQIPVPELPLAA